MTPGLSETIPRLATGRASCGKTPLRFDEQAVGSIDTPAASSDLRFFITVWAMGFVVFYSFLF
jgi:hypothetical protein